MPRRRTIGWRVTCTGIKCGSTWTNTCVHATRVRGALRLASHTKEPDTVHVPDSVSRIRNHWGRRADPGSYKEGEYGNMGND